MGPQLQGAGTTSVISAHRTSIAIQGPHNRARSALHLHDLLHTQGSRELYERIASLISHSKSNCTFIERLVTTPACDVITS